MASDSLKEEILAALSRSPGATVRALVDQLKGSQSSVTTWLRDNNGIWVRSDGNGRWYLHDRVEKRMSRGAAVADQASISTTPEHQILENQTRVKSNDELIRNVLESLRKRLLDLTSRNRLLSYRHPKSSSIRVIDELPDQLKRHLADDEREMRFIPVPDPTHEQLIDAGYIQIDAETGEESLGDDPTAREWAKWLGLDTEYDAPAPAFDDNKRKHSDNAIQTMFFPDELETRLRSMRQKANSAIEETGANILYLAIGFLEWSEHREAADSRLAPLYLIPVRLDRGKLNPETRTYEYRLSYSGEDILTNISLREKLRNDFQIALPELEDGVDPEQYIESVGEAVKTRQPTWRTRRYTTLCHLNFSKQLLYLDLDPARWPQGSGPTDHPLVRQCLVGLSDQEQDREGSSSFAEEYSLDDVEEIHDRYPLIDDADSSQHSALIDALDGKNLVIEGPPGTGKSQTITNLIAAAIARGKKVLFVAEKSAALEVVKRRLDQAHLGAFCLELHSHRSQKRRVLDDLDKRIKLGRRLRKPEDIESDVAFYEDLKERLGKHAKRINSLWKNTGSSIHQILTVATRYRNALSIPADLLHPEELTGDSFTPVTRKKLMGVAATFVDVYQGVLRQLTRGQKLGDHPWSGIQATSIRAFEQEKIVDRLKAWQQTLIRLDAERTKFGAVVGGDGEALPPDIEAVRDLVEQLASITKCDGTEPLFALPVLRGHAASEFTKGLQTYKAIQNCFDILAKDVQQDYLRDAGRRDKLAAHTKSFSRLAAPNLSLLTAREARAITSTIGESLEHLAEAIAKTNEALSLPQKNALSATLAGIDRFARLTEIVSSLEPELLPYRDVCFDNDELDRVIPKLSEELARLLEARKTLGRVYAIDDLPESARLREIESEFRQAGTLCWFSREWRAARRELLSCRATKKVRVKSLVSNLKQLVECAHALREFESNPDYKRLLGSQFIGLDTDMGRVLRLRTWYRGVRNEYGVGFGAKVAIGEAVIAVPDALARALRTLHQQGLTSKVEQITDGLQRLRECFPGLSALGDREASLTGAESALRRLVTLLAEAFIELDQAYLDEQLTVRRMAAIAEKLDDLALHLRAWEDGDICSRYLDDRIKLRIGVGQTDHTTVGRLERVASLCRIITSPEFPRAIAEKVYREPSKATIDLIRLRNELLTRAVHLELTAYEAFKEAVHLDESVWRQSTENNIDAILKRNQRAIENPESLASWLEYLRAKEQLTQLGWAGLAKAIESQSVLPNQWKDAFYLGASDLLAREILNEIPELATFSGLTQQGLRQQFQDYDTHLRELQRHSIAWKASRVSPPAGNASGPVRGHTEMALLEREIGKRMRHVPLRQLLARAGQTISTLKPCFLMGPMSVAQYLEPGQLTFDLIVMDEASQVRPEDAIGALARGGQAVVVGDPKQLPPTSFFDKLVDEEDEAEDYTTGQESESILDAALTTFPARRLRWHYRSQHESLIAFSNHAFYGSDLVIFPSPVNKAPEYGIQFTRVNRGRFVNRVNREEAALIAKAVRTHMLNRPDESIGVVAMSAQQREQIERAVEQETKEDAHFREVIEQNRSTTEPLFVKNLENVQGDERDVVYISMTYGPSESGGRVAQRFGPINTAHGWRRLNVLFTRAKKRMHVFSSMTSEDIVVSPSSGRGVQALKAFLEYAVTGNLSSTIEHSGRDPDSDFEVAVAEALSDHGFECVPQVGVAGYFLDIAVKDPGNPGRYLMAIECDGATYHSAKSTRDRDLLRQRILERLGWRVRRIWSTDWFNNPAAQLKPILEELSRLKTVAPPEVVEASGDLGEVEEIDEIAEDLEEEVELVSTVVQQETDVKTRLLQFDRDVIRKEFPETDPDRRFLRPAMIDALLLYSPTTLWEFQQRIPPYLRRGTEPKEGKFLKPVLEILYESTEDLGTGTEIAQRTSTEL